MESSEEGRASPRSQVLSETRQPSLHNDEEKKQLVSQPPDGPDGGLQGWLQVVAAFLLVLDGFGFITAFGVFQTHYRDNILPDSVTDRDISWIGSMQIFLLFLLGTVSGRLIDAGHFRITLIVGFVFQIGGVFAASFASQYWQFLLSQGIATGIGNGMHFTGLVWLVSQYFTKKRGLALGISSCGAPIGAVIFTIIARQMIDKPGYKWTLRTMGFLVLADSIIIFLIARPKAATRKGGPLLELSAFKELPYLLFTIGMFFALLGVYFAYYYVPNFGRNKLNLLPNEALTVLIVMSAVGIIGRLIPPFIADKSIKPLRTLVISLLLSSLNLFAWIAVSSTAGLYVWVAAYAFTANAVQTLFTASMGEVTSDMSKLGVRIGMVFTVVSFACLVGPPIGGSLVDINHDDYTYAQIFAGASMLLGGLLVAMAKIKQVGLKQFWRI
ncbi:major facilitator superfamily transporter [Colletotrichum graminicola]|uniref:Major facilitator superfamily transporter n=1 Tax=Colletotrichum graminicola (strain M1.001 / M2 / FGSC 10212) TaxID=645133 RepID=E3QZA2_COLGM|nr:major facilitator superfamily transporter [Colletotrichum graminicola M1.001]EFQ36190.1 major facilitator superfamily transporter [Colletotrichum graminicola M1.001]WDK16846.1 major facilitator superfamily transporter [Colletotrichum graminicola]